MSFGDGTEEATSSDLLGVFEEQGVEKPATKVLFKLLFVKMESVQGIVGLFNNCGVKNFGQEDLRRILRMSGERSAKKDIFRRAVCAREGGDGCKIGIQLLELVELSVRKCTVKDRAGNGKDFISRWGIKWWRRKEVWSVVVCCLGEGLLLLGFTCGLFLLRSARRWSSRGRGSCLRRLFISRVVRWDEIGEGDDFAAEWELSGGVHGNRSGRKELGV